MTSSLSKADAMADQVGFPSYLVEKAKFQEKFKKYQDVSITNSLKIMVGQNHETI